MNVSALKIDEVANQFKDSLKLNDFDHPVMNKRYEETANLLLKYAKWNLNCSMMLETNHVQTLKGVKEEIYGQLLKIWQSMEDMVYKLQQTKKEAKNARESYYKAAQDVDCGNKLLEEKTNEMQRGRITKYELEKVADSVGKKKEYAENERTKYKDLIDEVGERWKVYDRDFLANFGQFDKLEETRVNFFSNHGSNL
jgi:hypothetical protein